MRLSFTSVELVSRAQQLVAGLQALAERLPDAVFYSNDLGNIVVEDGKGNYLGYVAFRLGDPDVSIFDSAVGGYVDLVPDIDQPRGEA